tara:strand:- start:23 stop:847 length:825 start_codon:yes stop_codon:yes gene_type:complete
MLNVTDISSYLYCPRQFYLTRVMGLRQPPTQPMIEGSIRHKVREMFAKNEERLFENLELINHDFTKQKVIYFYQNLLDNIIKTIFNNSRKLILAFKINPAELREKIINSMKNEIFLRAESVENTIKIGFTGKELWENLTPKYVSELPLISENIGLKGRADRIMLDKETIIPFELKTRTAEKVYPSDKIQLTAYTMLLEEKYNKQIPIAILEAGNQTHEIEITESNKQEVRELISEINNLIKSYNSENKTEPKFPSNFAKCQKCNWKEQCDKIGQ